MCEQKYKGLYHFIFCFVIATLHEEVSKKGEGSEKEKELPSFAREWSPHFMRRLWPSSWQGGSPRPSPHCLWPGPSSLCNW